MRVLHDHQSKMKSDVSAEMRAGRRSVLCVGSTGIGKTVIAVDMIQSALARGKRMWFVVHRDRLADQASQTLTDEGISHGFIIAGCKTIPPDQVCVVSIQTAASRLEMVKEAGLAPDLIFFDEAHHATAATWRRIVAAFPKAFQVGFTATPARTDGRGLGDCFETMVLGPPMEWLIGNGFLSGYSIKAPPTSAKFAGLKKKRGDYDPMQVATVVDKPALVGDIVAEYERHAPGCPAIVFAANVAHSKHIRDEFLAAGYTAVHLDADSSKDERRKAFDDFETGSLMIICNVALVGEGTDVKGIKCVILATKTSSLINWLQWVGRMMRPVYAAGIKRDTTEGRLRAVAMSEKPRGILIDHYGNWEEHGLPDFDHAWDLKGKIKRGKVNPALAVKMCPTCFSVMRSNVGTCECGHRFIAKPNQIRTAEGVLVDIDPETMKRREREQEWACKSEDDFARLGRQRGYDYPERWAAYKWRGRLAARERRYG